MPACAGSACTSTAAAACAWPHRRLQRHGVSLAGTWQGGRLLQCCMLGSRRREHARLLTAAGHTTQTAFAGPSVARRVGRAPVASPAHCTASLPRQRPPWLSTFGSVCVRLCCRSSVHHLWQSTSPPAMRLRRTPYMFDFPSIRSMGQITPHVPRPRQSYRLLLRVHMRTALSSRGCSEWRSAMAHSANRRVRRPRLHTSSQRPLCRPAQLSPWPSDASGVPACRTPCCARGMRSSCWAAWNMGTLRACTSRALAAL